MRTDTNPAIEKFYFSIFFPYEPQRFILKLKTIFNLLYPFFPVCQVEETVITNDRTCFFDKITDREYVRLVISLS